MNIQIGIVASFHIKHMKDLSHYFPKAMKQVFYKTLGAQEFSVQNCTEDMPQYLSSLCMISYKNVKW